MVGEITDGQHSKKVGISFALIFDEADKSQLEKAKEELVRIEEESRTSGEIEVPDTLEGYQVHVEKTDVKEKLFWIYGLSILIIGILLEVELVHLKEAGERRDESLRAEYYQFESTFSLFSDRHERERSFSKTFNPSSGGCSCCRTEVYSEKNGTWCIGNGSN